MWSLVAAFPLTTNYITSGGGLHRFGQLAAGTEDLPEVNEVPRQREPGGQPPSQLEMENEIIRTKTLCG